MALHLRTHFVQILRQLCPVKPGRRSKNWVEKLHKTSHDVQSVLFGQDKKVAILCCGCCRSLSRCNNADADRTKRSVGRRRGTRNRACRCEVESETRVHKWGPTSPFLPSIHFSRSQIVRRLFRVFFPIASHNSEFHTPIHGRDVSPCHLTLGLKKPSKEEFKN